MSTQQIDAAPQKHTPGPWGWFGNIKHGGPYLATQHSGRQWVMGFRRLGMSHAQPVFQRDGLLVDGKELAIFEVCRDATSADDERVYRHDIVGFRSADAHLIAAAPDLYEALADFNMTKDRIVGSQGEDLVLRVPLAVIQKAAAALSRARGEA